VEWEAPAESQQGKSPTPDKARPPVPPCPTRRACPTVKAKQVGTSRINFEKSTLGGRVVTRMITDRRTDGRTMAVGASVTWMHCSVRYEVTWGKTLPSARTSSVLAMDAKGLHKGSSNIPFSLPLSPWPREATVCLVHFVVWAAIGGSFFGHTCCCSADQVFLYSTF
jgi:hypothetical protein